MVKSLTFVTSNNSVLIISLLIHASLGSMSSWAGWRIGCKVKPVLRRASCAFTLIFTFGVINRTPNAHYMALTPVSNQMTTSVNSPAI